MFYEKLCSICREKGTTPTTLCNELSLSTSLPTKWKNGADPRISTVQQIAKKLEVPVSVFFEDTVKANTPWSRITELCYRLNSNPNDVLKSLGMTYYRITEISQGNVLLPNELYALSEYFGVDEDYFFSFEPLNHLLNITSEEADIIIALRSHPELKGVIKKLLDLPVTDEKSVVS